MRIITIAVFCALQVGSSQEQGGSNFTVIDFPTSWRNTGIFWWIIQLPIPASYVDSKVFFYLYTRWTREVPQQLWVDNHYSLDSSKYDMSKKTVVIIHGFETSYLGESAQIIKNNYLEHMDFNVILIDYGLLTSSSVISYLKDVVLSLKIGKFVGRFLQFLISRGVNPDDIHLVGHSLGAHIAGFSGKHIKSTGDPVGRITGLDPCSPGYNSVNSFYRLAADDGKFTDCIFTSFGTLAVSSTVCQANYFPNGIKRSQPGCFWQDFGGAGCSHSRVVYLFAESIDPKSDFYVQRCTAIPSVQDPAACQPVNGTFMGQYANAECTGLFYLETNKEYPYSLRSDD